MNLEEKILYASRAKYGENQYIEDRLRKEIEVIKKKTSIEEVEFLLFLKENLDQNILIGNMPFLSLYLLGLSLINPLPAHYYNENTKELVFVKDAEYGVDLEKREGFCRDGFNIDPTYTFENKIYFEIRIDKKFKTKLDVLMREHFVDGVVYSRGKNERMERYDLHNISLVFLDGLTSLYYEKNISQDIDMEDFKKYLLEYHLNNKLELKNGFPRKVTESLEDLNFKENIKSYGDFLYLLGLTLTYTRAYSLFIDFSIRNYPSNREEIFAYYLDHGIDRESAGKFAYDISFFKADILPDLDPEIDDYLRKLNYTWDKTSLVKVTLYSYLDFKLTH
ncbi:hypothetical protein NH288_03060 [Anaerococcus sp. NML200537]|uniref:hypothetical protein n=1 Tax=Anaerococcus sp. NML200537 TaxID=2954485 RepID=UPI0022390DD8|nr:hypothetical protein [Anaerococcus sp. NML200537]MCW6701056.1 hypothetical protein [Anaerococcus sp. NML200537]